MKGGLIRAVADAISVNECRKFEMGHTHPASECPAAISAIAVVREQIEALHPSMGVYELADECGHDPDAPGYDDDHRENADGYVLCYLTRLTDICETCSDVDDECAWPCPTLTALGVTA